MDEVKLKAWVARDRFGSVYAYRFKPVKTENTWVETPHIRLCDNIFPQVKWTDVEPTEVELTIKIKEQ